MLLTCLQRKHGDSAVGATRPQPGPFSPSRLRGPNATGPTFFSSNSSQGKELGGDRAGRGLPFPQTGLQGARGGGVGREGAKDPPPRAQRRGPSSGLSTQRERPVSTSAKGPRLPGEGPSGARAGRRPPLEI